MKNTHKEKKNQEIYLKKNKQTNNQNRTILYREIPQNIMVQQNKAKKKHFINREMRFIP